MAGRVLGTRFKKLTAREIRFESNHLLVVDKPAGVLSQSEAKVDLSRNEEGKEGDQGKQSESRKPKVSDLCTVSKEYIKNTKHKPGNVYLGLCNRLDIAASGLNVFAKTSKMAAKMQKLFAERKVQKEYLVVVQGYIGKRVGTIKGGETSYSKFWAKRQSPSRGLMTPSKDKPDGDLHWAVVTYPMEIANGGAQMNTVLAVKITTGRRHQIRRQLASIGHPIIGDKLYGSLTQANAPYDSTGVGGILLHAHRLKFKNPIRTDPQDIKPGEKHTKRVIDVTAPMPDFWRNTVPGLVLPDTRELGPTQSYFDYAVKCAVESVDEEEYELD